MKRILSCACLVLLTNCKTTGSSHQQAVTVKPSALIGTAYDAVTQEFTGVSCLDISALNPDDYEMLTLGRFSSEERVSPENADLEAVFGSFQKSFYTTATGLRLSRPYEAMQRLVESDTDTVRLHLVQSEYGALRFRAQSHAKLRLIPEAQKMVQQIILAQGDDQARLVDAFIQTCGTGFLAGTRYKLSMVASLRWIFRTADEKKLRAPELKSMDIESWTDSQPPLSAMRVRYENYGKETRDLSLKQLGDMGNRDCSGDSMGACIDAYRLFINSVVPAWQSRLQKIADDFDTVVPYAFLSDPEVLSYRDVEPALAGISLEPEAREAVAWSEARHRFVELYALVYRKVKEMERINATNSTQPLQSLLQQISTDAAPCYRPLLRLDLCRQNAERLQADYSAIAGR